MESSFPYFEISSVDSLLFENMKIGTKKKFVWSSVSISMSLLYRTPNLICKRFISWSFTDLWCNSRQSCKKTNVIPVFENEQTDCWQKIHRKYPQKKQRSFILKEMEVIACCCSLIAGKSTSKRTRFQSLRKNRQIAGIIHQRNLRNETKKHLPQTDGSNCLLLLIALQENVQAIINQAIVDCPAIRNHKQLLAFL